MDLPTIGNYGQGKTKRPNTIRISLSRITLYFSYQTLVAFSGPSGLTVRRNIWGPTTGKHLAWIDGGSVEAKAQRLPDSEFEAAFETACKHV